MPKLVANTVKNPLPWIWWWFVSWKRLVKLISFLKLVGHAYLKSPFMAKLENVQIMSNHFASFWNRKKELLNFFSSKWVTSDLCIVVPRNRRRSYYSHSQQWNFFRFCWCRADIFWTGWLVLPSPDNEVQSILSKLVWSNSKGFQVQPNRQIIKLLQVFHCVMEQNLICMPVKLHFDFWWGVGPLQSL